MLPPIWFGHFVEYIQQRNRNCVQLEAFPDGFCVTSGNILYGIFVRRDICQYAEIKSVSMA